MHNAPRYFRSNEEAFAYACEAMDYAVRDGAAHADPVDGQSPLPQSRERVGLDNVELIDVCNTNARQRQALKAASLTNDVLLSVQC